MANQVVYGIVKDRAQAERLIQVLLNENVVNKDISVLYSDQKSSSSSSFQTGSSSMDTGRNWRNENRVTEDRLSDFPAGASFDERERLRREREAASDYETTDESSHSGLGHEKHTKAPEGATTGVTTGGIIGGVLGLLAGIGALAIPGLGPFIAAGPIMATLSGMGAGGTIGGLIGALVGSGIPEYEAKVYENRLREGGILIAVRTNSDDFASRLKEIFRNNGAEDVSISSEAWTSKNYNK